jgi:hypothetical protein
MEAVDELLQLDLLRTTDVPAPLPLPASARRRAVYEATRAGWRLGAHERCADALCARGATAAARATTSSARRARAIRRRRRPARGRRGSRRLAPRSAARWFGRRLASPAADAPCEERIELSLAARGALTAAGHFADSHEALLEAVALAADEPPATRAKLARACAAVEGLLGRQEQAGAPTAECDRGSS